VTPHWLPFLLYTLLSIAVQGVFALFEMACISFHKVRLQYYVSIGKKRAIWLSYLLNRPSRLFGTTLIGINMALQIGSECSRRFYESIHLNPDLSPITQAVIVIVFAELSPMFAARRHPEQAAMFLVPVMAALARILSPVIWTFDALSHLIHRLMGVPVDTPLFLSREEVRMAFEEKERGGEEEFNKVAGRIFQLKTRTVGELMTPLAKVQMAPASATVADVRHLLSIHYVPIVPVYHRFPHNIVGVAYLRDFLRIDESRRVIDHARPPWFVTKGTSILDILEQFRRNNQSVAIVIDDSGQSCGLLSLDEIMAQIFGPEATEQAAAAASLHLHLERTLPGDMTVEAFNREFQANLPHAAEDTLSDLITESLDHLPVEGETVTMGPYLFTVQEPTLRGVKMISVRSFQE
jgi:magnesium and cobalt exporter, CNNM family